MWYYLSFVFLSVLLVSQVSKKRLGLAFFIIVSIISALSFFVDPNETWDLFRHYQSIELYGDMGLDWIIANRLDDNPLTSLYLYCFSYLSDPRFFVFCTIFITYGFTFKLLFEITKDYNLGRKSIAWITLYLLSNWNYLLVVSNCRIFMLYAIIAYLFYMELVKDKYHVLSLVVYIAACFFHYGIVIVLIARLVLYTHKFIKSDIALIIISIILFSSYSYILPLLGSNTLINTIEEKIIAYQEYKVFGTLQYISSLANILLVAVIFAYSHWKEANKTDFSLISIISIFIIFLQITNYQIIIRETCLLASFVIIPAAALFTNNYPRNLITLFKLESIAILVYRCWYEYALLNYTFVF